MQDSPRRPFVPRVTPTRAQPAIRSADFAITRPFVPGANRSMVESLGRQYGASESSGAVAAMPPIEAFLDEAAQTASAAATTELPETYSSGYAAADDDELPPLEHFVDPLPPVEDFAAMDESSEGVGQFGMESAAPEESAKDSGEWGQTDWQQFDWRSAAGLGQTADTEATNAWAATDWDSGGPRARETRPTPAQALAIALDDIAQRIRDGQLAMPIGGIPSDPGSIAASLAALLGVKR